MTCTALPSTTRSRPSFHRLVPVVSATCGFRPMFTAFCSAGPVQKWSRPSDQTAGQRCDVRPAVVPHRGDPEELGGLEHAGGRRPTASEGDSGSPKRMSCSGTGSMPIRDVRGAGDSSVAAYSSLGGYGPHAGRALRRLRPAIAPPARGPDHRRGPRRTGSRSLDGRVQRNRPARHRGARPAGRRARAPGGARGTQGAEAVTVRRPEELAAVDGLVLPGGESTTIVKLAARFGLLEPLRAAVRAGLPAYGSCAGMILLADRLARRPAGPGDDRRPRRHRPPQRLRPAGRLLRVRPRDRGLGGRPAARRLHPGPVGRGGRRRGRGARPGRRAGRPTVRSSPSARGTWWPRASTPN